MRSKLAWIHGVWMCLALSVIGASAQESAAPTLAKFDEEVAVCRRVVREYCAIVQDMTKEKEVDAAKQEKGLTLLAEARKQWAEIQKLYNTNPPAEYAADAQFKARLQDIANAIEDMGEGPCRRPAAPLAPMWAVVYYFFDESGAISIDENFGYYAVLGWDQSLTKKRLGVRRSKIPLAHTRYEHERRRFQRSRG